MRTYHGLAEIRPLCGTTLRVRFVGEKDVHEVDLDAWIADIRALQVLRDPTQFAAATLKAHGRAVSWPDELDIGGDQIWRLAGEQSGELMPTEAFRAWRARARLSLTAAAKALGLSRRQIAYYESGEMPVPKTVMLATRGHDALAADERRAA